MTSTFTWLDYSEREKRKMLDVIEISLASKKPRRVRNRNCKGRFADLLFPGTSTIQTRARYFLFVPWIYLGLERRKTSADVMADLTQHRSKTYRRARGFGRSAGTIGVLARASLKRLPSNVYWQGLGVWGIRYLSRVTGPVSQIA